MRSEPSIAVIISCYNYEKYVARAIESVIAQGRSDVEIVVVDDGSTDSSWEIIQGFGVPAFKIENRGQRAACLYGLSQTRARFILFLDADDELKIDALNRIIQCLDPGVSKLQFSLTAVDSEGAIIANTYPVLESFRCQTKIQKQVLSTGLYRTPPTSGNVFRRDVCSLLQDCDYDTALDGVILFAAPFMGEIVSLPEPLGIYRIHDRNDSGLGHVPTRAVFEKEMRRFELRSKHLQSIIRGMAPDLKIPDYRKTYHYRSLDVSLAVCCGVRTSFREFMLLIGRIILEPHSYKWKFVSLLYFLAIYAAPPNHAKALLIARHSMRERSLRSMVLALLSGVNR